MRRPPACSNEAMELLRRGWPPGEEPKYDTNHALVLCRMHNFRPGLIFLYEHMRLFREVMQVRGGLEQHGAVVVCRLCCVHSLCRGLLFLYEHLRLFQEVMQVRVGSKQQCWDCNFFAGCAACAAVLSWAPLPVCAHEAVLGDHAGGGWVVMMMMLVVWSTWRLCCIPD